MRKLDVLHESSVAKGDGWVKSWGQTEAPFYVYMVILYNKLFLNEVH